MDALDDLKQGFVPVIRLTPRGLDDQGRILPATRNGGVLVPTVWWVLKKEAGDEPVSA